MAKKLGKVTIKANGRMFESKKGATLDIGGVTRSPVEHDQGTGDFSEEPRGSQVECTTPFGRDTSLTEIAAMDNVTLTFECDTGQTYVIAGAYNDGNPALTGGDGGEVKCVFYGPAAEEMK